MSTGRSGRGPARGDRGRDGAFAALLAGAAHEPEVAEGLAAAYGELPEDARRRLVDVVVADARASDLSPGRVLVHLLAVEEDPEIARALADAITADGEAGLEPVAGDEGRVTGDAERGAAALLQPLHGELIEMVAVRWNAGAVTGAAFEPVLRRDEADARLAALDLTGLEPAPARRAADLLAVPLWRHLRAGGEPPAGVARFARLFSF